MYAAPKSVLLALIWLAVACLWHVGHVFRYLRPNSYYLVLRPPARLDRDARVRQAVLSSLARCVASFQPHSIKHLWRLQEKLEKAGKVGLSELIRRFAGERKRMSP